jgi:hypothetical protein
MFDVMVKAGKNVAGKDIFNVYRVHDTTLSSYLRNVQDVGYYVVAVIPLFRKKEQILNRDPEESGISVLNISEAYYKDINQNIIPDISETYFRKDIDPRLLKTVSKEPPYVPVDSIGE